MPKLSDIVEILKLGVPGLGYLLAFLAYRLLRQETHRDSDGRAGILSAIDRYMRFSLILCVLGFVAQLAPLVLQAVQSDNAIRVMNQRLQQDLVRERKAAEERLEGIKIADAKELTAANKVIDDFKWTCDYLSRTEWLKGHDEARPQLRQRCPRDG